MKYPREREASANFLKLILKRMVEHPAAFTPSNYAVWYEYLAGLNPSLSDALNRIFDSNAKLDDGSIEWLYAQYISDYDATAQNELHEDVRQLLIRLAGFVAEIDKQTLCFGDSLQKYGSVLTGRLTAKELDSLVKEMAKDTDLMRSSMQQVNEQLNASKLRVELLQQELESVRGESMTDALTGILNRRGFESRINIFFSEPDAGSSSFSLLMLDIDHFKKINDKYGHPFGDKVICTIASAIRSIVKGQDIVARMGGEEFAVLLPQTNSVGAFVVAEKIRQGIEHGRIRRLDNNEEVGGITISIGIAAYIKGCSMAKLIDQADRALYLSKQRGRNQTTLYVDEEKGNEGKPESSSRRSRKRAVPR
ncbi:MAG: diguanylate cyclase [Gallionellaceae bacterium]|nr:diguanylate cyclase [Gallionellaceae bacterium]